jgi:glycosyltransferase involved in cell wall biosynthesis
MAKRILLLNTDLKIGGTPTVVRELATRLPVGGGGAHVQVACLGPWEAMADQILARGIAVTAFGAVGQRDWSVISKLIRLIRSERIDTVLSFLIHANTVAAIARPMIRDVRFFQSIQTTQPNPRWHWTLQRAVQIAAEKIIVPSPSIARIARDWAGIALEKIAVIPNAVDTTEFSNIATEFQGRRIGFIGRLDPVKRIDDLIRAIALLPPEIKLDIFGLGKEESKLRHLIGESNLQNRVNLRGPVATPQEALSQMDVLVLPSQAEGFGLVLIEAMAAGIAVIGTDVPGIRDVISHGNNGLLVAMADPSALARAIGRIISDSALRQKLIAAGRESVARDFSWPPVLERYRDVLKIE